MYQCKIVSYCSFYVYFVIIFICNLRLTAYLRVFYLKICKIFMVFDLPWWGHYLPLTSLEHQPVQQISLLTKMTTRLANTAPRKLTRGPTKETDQGTQTHEKVRGSKWNQKSKLVKLIKLITKSSMQSSLKWHQRRRTHNILWQWIPQRDHSDWKKSRPDIRINPR